LTSSNGEDCKSQNGRGSASDRFAKFAASASLIVGSRWAFLVAILAIVVWAVTGPFYHYSDTWQLIINTGTTVVTFLMVFLIQNSQNRDAKAINLKLNEVIRALGRARNDLIDAEKLSDEELERLAAYFDRVRREYESRRNRDGRTVPEEIADQVSQRLAEDREQEEAA
jgi:low affinity Fe/Cu permease